MGGLGNRALSDRPDPEASQLCSSVVQPICVVRLSPAGSDHTLKAFNLVGESTPANLDGPVSVRVHTVVQYRPGVTKK